MGKINSRRKGAVGELELSKELDKLCEKYGVENLVGAIERSQQFSGNSGDADVRGMPGIHIECKRVENLNIHAAYKQATEDSREGTSPVVMHRRNRGNWMATLSLDDFMKLYSAALKAGVL